MPKKCCIPNCRIQADDPEGLNLSFFQIPKDESRKKQWLTIINDHFKTEIKLPKFPCVCALHFEQTSFSLGLMAVNVRLKREACPSIFNDRLSIVRNKRNGINEQVPSGGSSNGDEKFSLSNDFGKCTKNLNEIPNNNVIKSEENISSGDKYTIQWLLNTYESDIGEANSSNGILGNSPQLKCSPNSSNENLGFHCAEPVSSKIYQKSFANINIDSINFKDETLVRALFKKAQNEIRDVRQKYNIFSKKLSRTQRKIKTSSNLVHHMKKRR